MKVLHKEGKWSIGILDQRNYVVWDNTVKPSYSYFAKLESAVVEVSRRTADEVGTDLTSWRKAADTTFMGLKTAIWGR